MPDTTDRDVFEGRMARELTRFGRVQMAELYDLLGDPPALDKVKGMWWDGHRDELAAVLSLILYEVYMDAAKEMDTNLPSGISDWTTIQQDAEVWSREYSRELATTLTANTRKALGEMLVTAAAFGWASELLKRRVMTLYGVARVMSIAITEVTRAITAAERKVAHYIALVLHYPLKPYWETAHDERVCTLCGPRDGKEITDGVYSPLHPRCRCRTNWRLR